MKKLTQHQKRHILEVQPFFVILIALLLFALLTALEHSNPANAPEQLNDNWTVSGEAVELLPERDIRAADETTVLTRILDDRFDIAQTICFYSVYEDVTVKLNDTVLYTFHRPEAESLVQAAPSYWNKVTIPGASGGSVLEIELTCPYAAYANHIGDIRMGDARQIEAYVARKTVPKFLMAIGLLFIAIVFSILAIYMRYHVAGSTGMYSLSLAMLVLAIFLASSQTTILVQLYSGTSYVAIQCLAFMLAPVMYTRYLTRTHEGTQKHISRTLYGICIVNMAVVFLLQLLHIVDMPEALMPTRVLCMITIVYIFILELLYHRRFLILFFAVAMVYGLIDYWVTGAITWLVYPGMLSYIYILGYRLINTVIKGKFEEVQLRTELEVSRSELATVQITSHFFYHTLDSIRALIRIDSDRAYKMTGDFAKYLRYRVDGVERMEEKVPFSRELRSIRAYTDIKQAQLGERFKMEFDVETEDFEILPLTVQPLVENSVIHAIQLRPAGGVVRLTVREAKDDYHIEVIDNGTGNTAEAKAPDEHKASVAIHNVNTRLAWYGIAPVKMEKNELGGMTASLNMPKLLKRKGT